MIFTEKRVVVLFLIYVLFFGTVTVQIASLNASVTEDALVVKSSRLIGIGTTRGMLYDRNSVPLVNRSIQTVLAVKPTAEAVAELEKVLTGSDFLSVSALLERGQPFVFGCDYYDGDCEDIIPLEIYDRYSESDVATHLIGYVDSEGNGVTGLESAFGSLLGENSGTLGFRYFTDAEGKWLGGIETEIVKENYASQAGLVLTLDYDVQRICERAMKNNSLGKGAVVVLDTDNGEILALASAPVFDRSNLGASLSDGNQPFFNRALAAYPVGSVFKTVVAAAALEAGYDGGIEFSCEGYRDVNSLRFNCHNRDGHGTLNMTEALSVSCNAYFISLGLTVDSEAVLTLASELGFGSEIKLCEGITSSAGNLPSEDDIDSSAALANLSFGQGALLATPLQLAASYSAFANGGYYNEPHLFKYIIDENGEVTAYYKNETTRKVLTEGVCKKIMSMLGTVVEEGSGKNASPMVGTAYGKTATAETGKTENGTKMVHTWFAGIFEYYDKKYTIVIFREDGGSASADCAPVFRDIADALSGEK